MSKHWFLYADQQLIVLPHRASLSPYLPSIADRQ